MTQTQRNIAAMLKKAGREVTVIDETMDRARADVLRATGRPVTMPETDAVRVGDLDLIKNLRKAAQ